MCRSPFERNLSAFTLVFCSASCSSFQVGSQLGCSWNQYQCKRPSLSAAGTTDDSGENGSSAFDASSSSRREFLAVTAAISALTIVDNDNFDAFAEVYELTEPATFSATSSTSPSLLVEPSLSYPICAGSEEENRIAIFERVAPSVVYIDTFAERQTYTAFSTNVMEVPLGSGSGYVWDQEGHIVTNFHVVQQAKSAQVAILTSSPNSSRSFTENLSKKELSTRRNAVSSSARPETGEESLSFSFSSMPQQDAARSVYKAKVIGVDPTKDIAVLKIEAPPNKLHPIPVGTSQGLRVGQATLAIGNPFGLDHTLTTGVISGIGREVKSPSGRPIYNVIQTDAAINPGNSGGPLLDSGGRMIGMATAIYSPSGASAGVGFAIPADTVKYIVAMLIEKGQIVRPLLGVSILDSKQARQALGITQGVLLLEVKPGTPAYQAGLRGIRRSAESGIIEIGDIITDVEGSAIAREEDLFRVLEMFSPGDVVRVTVNRPQVEIKENEANPEIALKELVFKVKLIASDDSSFLQK